MGFIPGKKIVGFGGWGHIDLVMNDGQLLSEFCDTASDDAFTEIVRRYAGLVLGVAVRRCGDRQLAEEVTQQVFSLLAAKAKSLASHRVLGRWLHRTTLLTASNALRREHTRKKKMKDFMEHVADHSSDHDDHWAAVRPEIDDALDRLSAVDRDVVIMRFFEGRDFRDIGRRLGKSDDACQKQTSRALGKLQRILGRRGITVTAAILAAALPGNVAEAVPNSGIATIARGAIAGSASVPGATVISNAIHNATYPKMTAASVAVMIAAIPLTINWTQMRSTGEELAALEAKRTALAPTAIGGAGGHGNSKPGTTTRARPARVEKESADWTIDDYIEAHRKVMEALDMSKFVEIEEFLSGCAVERLIELINACQAKEIKGHVGRQAIDHLLTALSDRDPRAAVGLAFDFGQSFRFKKVVKAWTRKEPADAVAWFEENLENAGLRGKGLGKDLEKSAVEGIAGGLELVNRDAALEFVAGLPGDLALKGVQAMAWKRREEFDALLERSYMSKEQRTAAVEWYPMARKEHF